MKSNTLTLEDPDYPKILKQLSSPPKQLYFHGPLAELLTLPRLAVVGSRKVTAYGKQITSGLAGEAARQGIVIVSGLALGVDALAHQAALDAGGRTLAVLPGSVDKIYPASHYQLARQIVESGGVLISESPFGAGVFKGNFVIRNRIIAGISDATLVTEAAMGSGSLHTARFTVQLGKKLLAVPGNITSLTSEGTNKLLKQGAIPITSADDILAAMGVSRAPTKITAHGNTPAENVLLQLIKGGESDGDVLLALSKLELAKFSQALTMLEINGIVQNVGSNRWVMEQGRVIQA